jgi:tRNA(fMet)-specific endonuclease VapC
LIAPSPEALLDTDTTSLYLRRDPRVRAQAAAYLLTKEYLTLSELTYYEVIRGLRSRDARRQLATFERLVAECRVLPFDRACADTAADLWADLRRRGLPIGEVDVLLAGTALAHGLAIVTHNVDHFNRVPGLTVIDWTI